MTDQNPTLQIPAQPAIQPKPKKGFWSKVANVIGELLGSYVENRR